MAGRVTGQVIRKMLPSEAIAVARLFGEAPEAAQWSARDLAEVQASGTKIWVFSQENKVTGAIASREGGGEAEILNLAVVAAWRRQGIGRQLIEAAVESAISAGVRRVFLEVRESNSGGRAFYSHLGFAEGGRRKNYYRQPAEDALLLSRTLE